MRHCGSADIVDNVKHRVTLQRESRMNVKVEVTDTFGGQANYCWVNRFEVAEGTDLQLVRRAKKAAGWNGLRCKVSDFGDMLEVRPVGKRAPCWIMFIGV